MLVDIVPNEHDAMYRVPSLPHVTLDLSASINKATENHCIDSVNALRAPSFI
jgi:hypothetical protein